MSASVAEVKRPFIREPRKLPIVLSPEGVARLLDAAPSLKHKAALSVAYGAGLRASEIISLKIEDIDSTRMVIRVDRRDIAREALRHLLPLRLGQGGPGRADRQPRHRGNIEGLANDRLQLRKTPALPEDPAVLHRAEQRVVEPLHGIAAARRRRMDRIGKHAEAEPSGKSRSFPQWQPWYARLKRGKSGYRQVFAPLHTADAI